MDRQKFICNHVQDCKETASCCPHKIPHIKDERCVPKECRYGPVGEKVDCVPVGEEKKPDPVKVIEHAELKSVSVEKDGSVGADPRLTTCEEPAPEEKKEQFFVPEKKKPGRKSKGEKA